MTTKGPLEDKRELLVRHVIPALDAGMALLHHSRKEQAVTDGICYKIDI
ncbi:hypothetical protein [Wolbachia endosymbiont (group B) of Aricia agestis]|nr:hypothetical protein [Wolbachia endosymbiont (group B) of Aricia agestis]